MFRTLTQKVSFAIVLVLLVLSLVAANVVINSEATAAISTHLTDHTISYALASGQFYLHLARAFGELATLNEDPQGESRDQLEAERAAAAESLAALARAIDEEVDPAGLDQRPAQLELQRRQTALFGASSQLMDTVIEALATDDSAALAEAMEQIESQEEELTVLEQEASALVSQIVRSASAELTSRDQYGRVVIPASYALIGICLLLALWALRRAIIAPLTTLAMAARQISAGDLSGRVTVTRPDEIGELQETFNEMAGGLQSQQAALLARERALKEMLEEVEQRAAVQEQLLTEVQQQQTVIHRLSVPVLPITRRTLVMPLVGSLDMARLTLVHERALQELERSQAQRLILDITGVPIVDPVVANGLIQIVDMARLLGAQVLLVGVQPEVAQGMVSAGISLTGIRTYRDLEAAVIYSSQE